MLKHSKPRVFVRPKEKGRPCEDIVLAWPKEGRFVVSDGASISYDSRGWARTLCWQFMRNTNVGADWVNAARSRFARRHAAYEDDWAASHAADRGSFATFLAFTLTDSALKIYAIGDSVLFLVTLDNNLIIHPNMAKCDFAQQPILLCCRSDRSAFDDSDESFLNTEFVKLVPECGWGGSTIIAATDAVAEWIISAEDEAGRLARLNLITGHTSQLSFERWISETIASGEMRRDDCSVLILDL